MQCMSCNSEIDPKWKFAIDNNSCPFCGQVILPEDLKELLSSLRSNIDSLMESYSNQLDDWMLSNFNYIKTDSPNIKDYIPKYLLNKNKIDNDDVGEDSDVIARQDPEVTAKFFKNTKNYDYCS